MFQRAFWFTPSSSSGTVVQDVMIQGGGVERRGGAILIEGASPTIRSCVFNDNLATGICGASWGGAIYLKDSDATVESCTFVGNRALPEACTGTGDGFGGAVYVSGGAPTLIDCHFGANAVGAAEFGLAGGGALGAADGADITIIRSAFHNNSLGGFHGRGAAIMVENATVGAVDCLMQGNKAGGPGFPAGETSTAFGGAAFVGAGGHLTLLSCRLLFNSASPLGADFPTGGGGAVAVDGGTAVIVNSVLADSEAVAVESCDPVFLVGGRGGALHLSGDSAVLVQSSTMVNSVAQCGGNAIYISDTPGSAPRLEIANSIIWESADAIEPGTGDVDIRFSDIQGGWPGEGNIDSDPMLDFDYRLGAGSPAADAGANDLVPSDIFDLDGDGDTTERLPLDLAGERRFSDDPAAPDTGRGMIPIVDMGAYETPGDFCYADCDGSGGLDFFDFLCFQDMFAAMEPGADCDGSGQLDFFDFLCFQSGFAAGCE